MYYNSGSFFKKINNEVKVMKKSLLLILASLFAIFALAGCAEDSKNDTPAPTATPIDLSSIEKYATLVGTYEITFFYTDGAGMLALSNDCANVPTYIAGAQPCAETSQVTMQGKGTITMDVATQTGKLVTKMQMTNDCIKRAGTENACPSVIWIDPFAFVKDQQYNYTVFTDIPLSAISANGINLDNTVKGTTGRTLTQISNVPDSTYSFTIADDKLTIINNMVDESSIMPANVTIRMKKISDIPETLDANVAFDTPVIEGFVTEPTATPAN